MEKQDINEYDKIYHPPETIQLDYCATRATWSRPSRSIEKVSPKCSGCWETPKPIPALPCLVRGYPSNDVTTDAGVPGAFMSMIGHNLLNQIILENASRLNIEI